MRLWSLHPQQLDSRGLVALWREGLLARKVLMGQTKGYVNHPQLIRFNECIDPVATLDIYLTVVCQEAEKRGYKFNRSKITAKEPTEPLLLLTSGQLKYEFDHLLSKLRLRDQDRFEQIKVSYPLVHPLFSVVDGGIEKWERVR